jgi:hypothetical protein
MNYIRKITIEDFYIIISEKISNQAWLCTPVIPALRSQRQEHCNFQASLSYIVRPFLKENQPNKKDNCDQIIRCIAGSYLASY